MNVQEYAVRFEAIVKKRHPEISLSADTVTIHPQEALETLLDYLVADGLIETTDIGEFLEEYDFGEGDLRTFIARRGEEPVKELLRRMESLWRNGEEV